MRRYHLYSSLTLAASLLTASGSAVAQVGARDSTFLVATSQALLDAITTGDSTVWASYLAPDWFLSDEEGHHHTRREFLTELHPLPPGQSGQLTVANVHLVGARAVAVISYDAQEVHHYYGQLLLTTRRQPCPAALTAAPSRHQPWQSTLGSTA